MAVHNIKKNEYNESLERIRSPCEQMIGSKFFKKRKKKKKQTVPINV